MMFAVRDRQRILKFEGILLAHSSSERGDSTRWVTFDLYRTSGGQYVVGRVGISRIFHRTGCEIVRDYRLSPAPAATLTVESVPCDRCQPYNLADNAQIFVETDRPLAQVCPTPEAVLRFLERRGEDGPYLTRVAEVLLERASCKDGGIADTFRTQLVL
jgi:hypothetical protein